jgi:hypothetical protein
LAWDAAPTDDAREVHDHRARTLSQEGEGGLACEEEATNVRGEHLVKEGGVELFYPRAVSHPCVVDEEVEAPEGLVERLKRGGDRGGVGKVTGEDEVSGPLKLFGEGV